MGNESNNTALTVAATAPTNADELIVRLRQIRAWKAERIAEVENATAALTAGNYRREKLNAYDGIDKTLSDLGKAVTREAMPDWAKAMAVEIAATRNEIKAAVEARKDKMRELKDENEPKPEQFEFIIEVRTDQKTFEGVCKKLDKDEIPYRARRVKDGESAKVGKLFDTVK